MAYTGSIDLISGIRPKNNGSFPLVDAKDVYVTDEKRLNIVLAEKADADDVIPKPAAAGTEGQHLEIDANGDPVWLNPGTPTDTQVGDAVDAWLTAHPEATTTVQDGTITRAKLDADLQEKTDAVPELKSAINGFFITSSPRYVNDWEQGYIRQSDGSDGTDSACCRTPMTSMIQINEGSYVFSIADGYSCSCYEYSSVYQAGYVGRSFHLKTGSFSADFSSAHYYRFSLRKTDESAFTPGDIPSNAVAFSLQMKTDKSLTIPDFAADAKATGDAIDSVKTMFGDVISISPNLLNPDDVTEHAYISPTGLQTSAAYANWFATGYIDVNSETLLQASIPIKSVIVYNADGSVDAANSYSGINTSATLPFTLPATANKIRISAYMTDLVGAMINYGESALPYQPYGAGIDPDALHLKDNPVIPALNSRMTSETYMSACKQALKKNVLLSYYATFTGFSSLKIGFTTTDTYSTGFLDYVEITGTNFVLHRKNQNDITWPHGLTLKDYVSVHITFDFSINFSAVVKTNGGEFAKTNYFYLGASYYPFAIIDATGAANNNLSFSCSDFQKSVLMFGDSYFSNSSTRWMYYLTDDQRKNLCINGYAGESSPSAIIDCESLFSLCTPKFAVWCLGMNDGSDADDTTPSTQWLTNVQKFINFCAAKNIQPILATIPSVPTINNRAKSAWVRASGYRYIDFAYAVNNGNDGSWYDNMLSGDGVHPDVAGAKALCARAITDFPELLID